MKKIIIPFLLFLLFSNLSYSQDKIYRNNGKVILARVTEVGSSEVRYKEFDNLEGPTYVLETDRIAKIVYENGKIEKFQDNLRDPERYAGQSTRGIKVNFLSPLYGYFEIGYEKSVSFGKSYEFSAGIIGAGKSSYIGYYNSINQVGDVRKNPFGAFISGGYKFSKLPDFLFFGKSKASHIMQGTYVKPAVYFGAYKENIIVEKGNNLWEAGKQNVTFGALQVEFGRQWVMGNKLIVDFYSGLGYGFDNKKDVIQYYNSPSYYFEEVSAFNYANFRAGRSPGLSLSFGIKLGLLLNEPKAKE